MSRLVSNLNERQFTPLVTQERERSTLAPLLAEVPALRSREPGPSPIAVADPVTPKRGFRGYDD